MNSHNCYSIQSYRAPNLLGRFFKRQPKENALIEINNRLAQAKDIKEISIRDILEIGEEHGVDVYGAFTQELKMLFAQYLKYCLLDLKLTKDEIQNIQHLQRLFYLSNETVKNVQQEVCRSIYEKAVQDVISDGVVTEEEKENLKKLQKYFSISQEDAEQTYEKQAEDYIQKMLSSMVKDQRLSPDEEKYLHEIAQNMGVKLDYDDITRAALELFKLYWQIENGAIPEINVGINLHKNESCYFVYDVNWLENRKVTRRIRYSGPTVRIKIMKGVYWRAGDLGIQKVSEDVLQKIDTGRIYLTNKRIIFVGANKSITIPLTKVLDFVAYKNGVEIQKSTGKNPFLEFNNSVQLFCMIFERVLREL